MTRRMKMRRPPPPKARVLSASDINITREAKNIIDLALAGKSRVIQLGALVFFSTFDGDAWMLDTEDRYALGLALEGQKQAYNIVETDQNFMIEWNADYDLVEDAIVIRERSGEVITIENCPAVLLRAVGLAP